MPTTPIRVFLADDHHTVLDGLVAIFQSEDRIRVVGRARNGEELLRMVRNKPIDVILLDISMPVISGLEALPLLRKEAPDARIIMLSGSNLYSFISEAMNAGADGYLTKDADRREIVKAVLTVAEGRSYYNAEVTDTILRGQRSRRDEQGPVTLTSRERLIVCMITKELTSREIGEKLGISSLTVERHRRNVFAKLQVKNVVGLVKYALENGLAKDDCEEVR